VDSLPQQPGHPSPYVLAPTGEESESSFDFWGVLNRRKWLVFLGLVSGMGLGALYDAQCDTIYESVAKIKIEPKDPLFIPMAQGGMIQGASNDAMIRHDQLIGQYNIVNQCLNKYELMGSRSFENLPESKIIPTVLSNLEVEQNREEAILYELTYRSTDADDAQIILNNMIATYEENLEEHYKTKTREVTTLLRSLEKKFETEYKQLQFNLDKTHSENNSIVVAVGQLNQHQVQIRQLSESLQTNQAKIGDLSLDLERATLALQSTPEEIAKSVWSFKEQLKIIDDGKKDEQNPRDVFQIEGNIRQLKMQRLSLIDAQNLGSGHRLVKSLDAAIADETSYLEKLQAGLDESSDSGLEPHEVLNWFVSKTRQQISDLRLTINKEQQAFSAHLKEASRIADIERRIDDIKLQMQDVREYILVTAKNLIEADSGDPNQRQEGFRFQKLQDATVGEVVWPILPIILGIGGLLGSVIGFGLGCLVELADKTFHNPDEIMKQLNVPLIGHVPVIGQSKRYLIENSLIEPIICTYHRPKSQVSEAFRAVRTALYFNTQGKNHSVIQITSPTPGDGKSTLASNLAVSIAQSGKRILLVDADMRRPRQHSTFGISSKEGFATVLSGQSQWRDVMYECEEIEGLTIMPCGAKPNNPAELSSSPQVKVLIEEMRAEFDFVIIDTPPLLAVTDPCPIAARVDGVILCLRIKKNVRVSAERSIEMLASLGSKCIGLVVNGVGAQSGYGSQYTYGAYRAGYSYNGYGYGYGYGTGGGKYYDDDKKGRSIQPTPKIESAQFDASHIETSQID
jgi:succinoglycan biosynthesis transport protein ExoP